MSEPDLITVGEVAQMLRVNDVTVRRWIQRKELPAINLGGKQRPDYRIRRDEVERFVMKRGTTGEGSGQQVAALAT